MLYLQMFILSFHVCDSVVLQLWTARRVYYFAAENVETVDRWVKGLLKSIHSGSSNFVKNDVLEHQRMSYC